LLAIDVTAVGRPVSEMVRRTKLKARIVPIPVTGGHKATRGELGGFLVPKKDLASTLQVLLQSRRIKVAPSLREAETLVRELLNFKMKVPSTANDAGDPWREGPHALCRFIGPSRP
jgi:hypothetical protein